MPTLRLKLKAGKPKPPSKPQILAGIGVSTRLVEECLPDRDSPAVSTSSNLISAGICQARQGTSDADVSMPRDRLQALLHYTYCGGVGDPHFIRRSRVQPCQDIPAGRAHMVVRARGGAHTRVV